MLNKKQRQTATAVLCIVLLLCYPLLLFFAHLHQCTGEDCFVCNLLACSKDLSAVLLSAFSVGTLLLCNKPLYTGRTRNCRKSSTPVRQKVKLSN